MHFIFKAIEVLFVYLFKYHVSSNANIHFIIFCFSFTFSSMLTNPYPYLLACFFEKSTHTHKIWVCHGMGSRIDINEWENMKIRKHKFWMKYENFLGKSAHSMENSEKVKFISFVDAKNLTLKCYKPLHSYWLPIFWLSL